MRLRGAVTRACARFRNGEPGIADWGVALSDYIRSHPERSPGIPPEAVANEPYILGNIAAIGPAFRRFLSHDGLWTLSARLLEVPADHVVYHYGQVLRKPAHIGPALGWHRDYGNTYISTDGPFFVRLLVPLQRMSAGNGGTGVVPGSHVIDDEAARASEGAPQSDEGAVYPVLAPGDVLAIHSKVVHGGRPNRTSRNRDLAAVQFGVRGAPMLHTFEGEYLSLRSRTDFALP
jgi:hypothetical protein